MSTYSHLKFHFFIPRAFDLQAFEMKFSASCVTRLGAMVSKQVLTEDGCS